jgi:hypothetical protein
MPRKNSKKSIKKKSVKKNTNSLEFNVNLDQNPNAIVDPVMKSINDENKLSGILNGLTQNSFNDGVDTTINNAAMLLNTQLNEVIGSNPGMFNQKSLEKMLKYVIEPTFNQLNEMANNTNYNYNQFGGVIGQNEFNNNLQRGEQKGGFLLTPRVRTSAYLPTMRKRIIPRIGFNPRLIMPRTMIVPSYTIITHDKIRDAADKRDRKILNNYVSHLHSFSTNDSKEIRIRHHTDVADDKKVDSIERLGDQFYKITVEGKDYIVYGLNLYYSENKYRRDTFTYPGYYQILNRIAAHAMNKSKKDASKLQVINNDKLGYDVTYEDPPGKTKRNNLKNLAIDPIMELKRGYFKGSGSSDWNYHVMMLEHVVE